MLTIGGGNASTLIENRDLIVTNLTGGALVPGGLYALDISAANAGSTSPDAAVGNVVAIAAANIRGFIVCATSAIPAGANGLVKLKGRTNVLLDGSGTNIAKGDKIKPTAASTNGTKLAAGQLVVPCAIAQAACTTAGALVDCLFDGETWKCELAAS